MNTQTYEDRHEALKRRALTLSGQVFVRIRELTQSGVAGEAQVKLIETLANGAHNLPQIVAQFGENGWACEETLLMECGLCEDALKQSMQFGGGFVLGAPGVDDRLHDTLQAIADYIPDEHAAHGGVDTTQLQNDVPPAASLSKVPPRLTSYLALSKAARHLPGGRK
ncbi:hypothetical protein AWV80_05785 [Cupriavidus sp. UYMU48A]|nr:hypothetical protein AWV80_05785 [Cupriavidus sp. UYMU48A]